jgi:hypothetical protein
MAVICVRADCVSAGCGHADRAYEGSAHTDCAYADHAYADHAYVDHGRADGECGACVRGGCADCECGACASERVMVEAWRMDSARRSGCSLPLRAPPLPHSHSFGHIRHMESQSSRWVRWCRLGNRFREGRHLRMNPEHARAGCLGSACEESDHAASAHAARLADIHLSTLRTAPHTRHSTQTAKMSAS